jgi:Uma2 family endonuclease
MTEQVADLVSEAEYLSTVFEPDAEFVDGVIEERHLGELQHAKWQKAIQRWFVRHEEQWNIRSYVELGVQVSATRYCVPDVLVLDHALPEEEIITMPPLAVFEVLSREDRMTRTLGKLRDYELMGIPVIRIVEPKTTTIWSYADGDLSELQPDLDETQGRLRMNWPAIRELLD